MKTEIIDHLATCDPRYQGHLPDGRIVLLTEDGRRAVSPIEFAELCEGFHDVELFYATYNVAVDSLAERDSVPSAEVAEILFDLRLLFRNHDETMSTLLKGILRTEDY